MIKYLAFGLIFLSYCHGAYSSEKLNEESSHSMELRAPAMMLMTQGGDDRLVLNRQTGVNKYYTMPEPQLDIIARSSCTSSFPTERAFHLTQEMQKKLLHDELMGKLDQSFAEKMAQTRSDVLSLLQVSHDDAYALLTPSGSDAELFFSLLGLLRHEKWQEYRDSHIQRVKFPCVLNIVVAAGEVGSGTSSAAGGRYFSSLLPRGGLALVGSMIKGFPEHVVEVKEVALRHKQTGTLESPEVVEEKIEQLLFQAIDEKKQVAVLHHVHASKTGFGTPRIDFVKRMKKKYGKKLVVVIDFAQMRSPDGLVSEYLKQDFCLFITGSKFFGGPPFSGLVIFPIQEAQEFNFPGLQKLLPEGLGDYFSCYDVDERLHELAKALPAWKNYGLLLRWHAALVTMYDFYHYPVFLRNEIARQWVAAVRKKAQSLPYLQLLEDDDNDTQDSLLGQINTIISCSVLAFNESEQTTKSLQVGDLRFVYQLLTKDIASQLPKNATKEEAMLAKNRCFVGQPVELALEQNNYGVLRIALDAPLVSRVASKCADSLTAIGPVLEEELADDERLLKKMSLIGKYYNFLKKQSV